MAEQELEDLIRYPNEERHLEFKGTIYWDGDIRAKITKSIMALANLKDGGWIIIGKEEQPDRSFKDTGMEQRDFDSFDSDCVKAYVYERTEPPVNFQIIKKIYDNKKFILIKVKEFDQLPIMCKKSYEPIIYAGNIYVRSKGKPESIRVPRDDEMREIIQNAIDKGITSFVQRLQRTGIWAPKEQIQTTDDEAEYKNQRADLT